MMAAPKMAASLVEWGFDFWESMLAVAGFYMVCLAGSHFDFEEKDVEVGVRKRNVNLIQSVRLESVYSDSSADKTTLQDQEWLQIQDKNHKDDDVYTSQKN